MFAHVTNLMIIDWFWRHHGALVVVSTIAIAMQNIQSTIQLINQLRRPNVSDWLSQTPLAPKSINMYAMRHIGNTWGLRHLWVFTLLIWGVLNAAFNYLQRFCTDQPLIELTTIQVESPLETHYSEITPTSRLLKGYVTSWIRVPDTTIDSVESKLKIITQSVRWTHNFPRGIPP